MRQKQISQVSASASPMKIRNLYEVRMKTFFIGAHTRTQNPTALILSFRNTMERVCMCVCGVYGCVCEHEFP